MTAIKRQWIKWGFFVLFKMALDGPFIIAGPIALLACWLGIWNPIGESATGQAGAWLCLFFCFFCIPDLISSVLVPWIGGGPGFPVWWENASPWARKGAKKGGAG